MLKKILLGGMLISMLSAQILQIKSQNNFTVTFTKLEHAIEKMNMKVFGIFDHSKEAKDAGLDLDPTKVIVFGNPKVGTNLMLINQNIAYDLPLRILVIQKGSDTFLKYENPEDMASKYNLQNHQIIKNMSNLMQMLTKEAASK